MSAVERASASGSSSDSDSEEMSSEESAAQSVEQLAALQSSLDQLETMLAPLLHTPLNALTQQLQPLQAAKLQAALAYATNALFFSTTNNDAQMRCETLRGGAISASQCRCQLHG